MFTTHPKNEPQSGTQWPDDDGYWTGNGSLPRAAQHGALSMSLYAPVFANPGPPLDCVRLPAVHPRVLPAGAVRRGRAGGRLDVRAQGRAATSRSTRGGPCTGARTATRRSSRTGCAQPFDLVADGGPDNVWLTQVGDAVAVPRTSPRSAPRCSPTRCRSTPRPANGALPGGFDVALRIADRGRRQLRDDRAARGQGRRRRARSPASATTTRGRSPNFGASAITIADTAGALKLDFAHGSRVTSVTGR